MPDVLIAAIARTSSEADLATALCRSNGLETSRLTLFVKERLPTAAPRSRVHLIPSQGAAVASTLHGTSVPGTDRTLAMPAYLADATTHHLEEMGISPDMVEDLDKVSVHLACDALRTAIVRRAGGHLETMRTPMRALTGLEHAALNAPQNAGWLRKRRIELRTALNGLARNPLSGADEVHTLYETLVASLRNEPHRWPVHH